MSPGNAGRVEPVLAPASRRDALGRLSKVRGQVAGLSRMVESDRQPTEILQQSAAIQGALRALDRRVLVDHLSSRFLDQSAFGRLDPQTWEEIVNEVMHHMR